MNRIEYENVKNLTYLEYCDYLQQKYGISKYDYFFNENYNKDRRVSRTNEGLVTHHKMEYKAIMLSNSNFAKLVPFEYQKNYNLVYCDYLEHLLLHVMIVEEYLISNINSGNAVGLGGVINFISPELNDVYSGFKTKQGWRQKCFDKVINDKDIYLDILKRCYDCYPIIKCYTSSFNAPFGIWSNENNKKIYREIQNKLLNNNKQKEEYSFLDKMFKPFIILTCIILFVVIILLVLYFS